MDGISYPYMLVNGATGVYKAYPALMRQLQ